MTYLQEKPSITLCLYVFFGFTTPPGIQRMALSSPALTVLWGLLVIALPLVGGELAQRFGKAERCA